MKKQAILATTLALCAAISSAQAQTYTVKFGAGFVDPHATSTDLEGTVPGLPASLYQLHKGATLEVQPQVAVLASISRALTPSWDIELMLGAPPTHDVKLRVSGALKAEASGSDPFAAAAAAKLAAYDGKVMSTVKSIAPTLFLNYKFGAPTDQVRPFVGVGVNYTHFEAKTTSEGDAFYHDGPVKIRLSDSFGLAAQVGLVYKVSNQWSMTASVASAFVRNSLEVQTANSAQTASFAFQPMVMSLMAGYSF